MDAARIYQMGSLLLIEAVQIRNMLEIVRVKVSRLYNVVRLHIIGKYLDLKRIALCLEQGLCLLQNLRVRNCRCRYLNRLVICAALSAAGQ